MAVDKANVNSGCIVYFDPEMFMAAYGAHAVRLTPEGEIQVLMITTEGAGWETLDNADLVQPVGRPAKARRQ